jgi:putative transposase
MARRPRLELPGVPLHLIQRGNNRGLCFRTDEDRRLYLRCLATAAARHECAIHAYVLMPNHVHLLVTPNAVGSVASLMQDVGRRYVRLFNDSHERTGTLWEGRYKSSLVDSETYLLTCHRYIESNPVRAGLVAEPLEFRWSSHAFYALGADDSLLTPHAMFDQLATDDSARRSTFRSLFGEPIETQMIERIRAYTKQGWALGSDSFLERVEAVLGRSARPPKRGRPFNEVATVEHASEMLI